MATSRGSLESEHTTTLAGKAVRYQRWTVLAQVAHFPQGFDRKSSVDCLGEFVDEPLEIATGK